MKTYLGNAFSFGMVSELLATGVRIDAIEVHPSTIPKDAISVVGHQTSCVLYGNILNREVALNRTTTVLEPGDVLYIGQYCGPRLEEGATSLPEGALIKWTRVEVSMPLDSIYGRPEGEDLLEMHR